MIARADLELLLQVTARRFTPSASAVECRYDVFDLDRLCAAVTCDALGNLKHFAQRGRVQRHRVGVDGRERCGHVAAELVSGIDRHRTYPRTAGRMRPAATSTACAADLRAHASRVQSI